LSTPTESNAALNNAQMKSPVINIIDSKRLWNHMVALVVDKVVLFFNSRNMIVANKVGIKKPPKNKTLAKKPLAQPCPIPIIIPQRIQLKKSAINVGMIICLTIIFYFAMSLSITPNGLRLGVVRVFGEAFVGKTNAYLETRTPIYLNARITLSRC
jgi:hypothetical protein